MGGEDNIWCRSERNDLLAGGHEDKHTLDRSSVKVREKYFIEKYRQTTQANDVVEK